MRVAIAQLNQRVGDIAGNARALAVSAAQARAGGAALLVTPELSICGYPPEDLVQRHDFLTACAHEVRSLAAAVRDIVVLVGFPEHDQGRRYNAVAVLRDGRVADVYRKQCLPNHGVFDEVRYFAAGTRPCVVSVGSVRCGIVICEDLWHPEPARQARAAGAELLLAANASPYHTGQHALRREALAHRARECDLPIVYVNRVGGQDELVFDGASFVADAQGRVVQQWPAWHEAVGVADIESTGPRPVRGELEPDVESNVYAALVMAVRDYAHANGFDEALLGLSGGVDSALTLAIAVDALGPGRVRAVMMPSPYTAAISVEDARTMAGTLGVRYDEMRIGPALDALLEAVGSLDGGRAGAVMEENLQARIRGTLLMALSNRDGALLLTTGNKSELAVGYATLYGDMAGGFAVLKDVPKTLVMRLAAWRNALGRVIPARVLERPPSAELRHGQTDQDTLPPYDVLDAILEAYVEREHDPAALVADGLPAAAVRDVVARLHRNEYKRRQSAVGPRITSRNFGKAWRYPIASAWDAIGGLS